MGSMSWVRSARIGARGLMGVLALATLAACAGPTNEQFATVAQSGITFTTQVPSVYRYQMEKEIDASSERYVQRRALAAKQGSGEAALVSALTTQLKTNNTEFTHRRALMGELVDQSEALRAYFVALNALALGAEGDPAAAAATDAAKGVEALVNRIQGKTVDGSPLTLNGKAVSDIIGQVTGLVVGQIRNQALKKNLEEYGTSVLGLIAIQKEALQEIETVNVETAQAGQLAEVVAEFNNPGKTLPSDWSTQRKDALLYDAPTNPVSSALEAATALEEAFRALAAGDNTSLDRLQNAVALTAAIFKVFNI